MVAAIETAPGSWIVSTTVNPTKGRERWSVWAPGNGTFIITEQEANGYIGIYKFIFHESGGGYTSTCLDNHGTNRQSSAGLRRVLDYVGKELAYAVNFDKRISSEELFKEEEYEWDLL